MRIAKAFIEVERAARQLVSAGEILQRDQQDALSYGVATARVDQAEAALATLEQLLDALRRA